MLLDDSIREFLEIHGAEDFPHAPEVMALLRDYPRSAAKLEVSTGGLSDRMRMTYRVRADIAANMRSTVSPDLHGDLASLARSLDEAGDQPIRVWRLPRGDGRMYLVFELLEDARIAGCVDAQPQS